MTKQQLETYDMSQNKHISRRSVLNGVGAAGGAVLTAGVVAGQGRPESDGVIPSHSGEGYLEVVGPMERTETICDRAYPTITGDVYPVILYPDQTSCNQGASGELWAGTDLNTGDAFTVEHTNIHCLGGEHPWVDLTPATQSCGEQRPPGQDRLECQHKQTGEIKELPRKAAETNPAWECDFNGDGDYDD